jgi:hypothetical protein
MTFLHPCKFDIAGSAFQEYLLSALALATRRHLEPFELRHWSDSDIDFPVSGEVVFVFRCIEFLADRSVQERN